MNGKTPFDPWLDAHGFTVVFDPGAWFIAPLGSTIPDMEVDGGRFVAGAPEPIWRRLRDVQGRVGLVHNGAGGLLFPERPLLFEDVLPVDGVRVMLGWESTTADMRAVFHRVLPTRWHGRFAIEAERLSTGHSYTIYAAGIAPWNRRR